MSAVTTPPAAGASPVTAPKHTGLASSKWMPAPWYVVVPFLVIIVVSFFFLFGGRSARSARKDKNGNQTETIRSSYDLTYELKVGASPTRIKIPIGYGVEYSDPGEGYYRQTEGHEKDILGGGRPYKRQSEHTRYVELSAYEHDVSVTVYFKKL